MSKVGCTYILASRKNGTLYVGVTSDLPKRIYQHREGMAEGFSNSQRVHLLVHYEASERIADAIAREKQLKNWERAWKVQLIEEQNPEWNDLYPALF